MPGIEGRSSFSSPVFKQHTPAGPQVQAENAIGAGHGPVAHAQEEVEAAHLDSQAPALEFDASCQREMLSTYGAAERAVSAGQGVAELLRKGAKGKLAGRSEAAIAADLAEARATREVADIRLRHCTAALSAVTAHRPADALLAELDGAVDALPEPAHVAMAAAGVMRSPLPSAAGDQTPGSYADFWDKLGTAIGGLKKDYLGTYERAVEKNNAFYRDFTDFVTKSTEWTKGDKDITLTLEERGTGPERRALTEAEIDEWVGIINDLKKDPMNSIANYDYFVDFMGISGDEMRTKIASYEQFKPFVSIPGVGFLTTLNELVEKYEPKSGDSVKNGVLVTVETDPADGADAEAKAEAKAKKWAEDMGLPNTSVERNPDDPIQWWVKVDLEPVKNLITQLVALKAKPGDTTVTLTPARHTSYQSGSEAQKEQLKTTASTLGKKMANAQSIYENLIKVLTSTIGAMLDTAKSFFQN